MKIKRKQAFTLIELLVAVLIIAILAAVAVPQYNKVIRRAQGREALHAINALDNALYAYYLQRDTYEDISEETLDIQLPQLKYFNLSMDSQNGKKEIILESTPPVTTKLYIKTFLDNAKPSHKWYCSQSANFSENQQSIMNSYEKKVPITCADYFDCPAAIYHSTGSSNFWQWDNKCVLK